MGEPHFCYCVSFVLKTAGITGFLPLPRLAPQGKCLLIRARCRFGFRPVPCGFLGHMVVLDQSGIHLADEVLYGNGCHFGTAQLDRAQQLDADKVIHHVLVDLQNLSYLWNRQKLAISSPDFLYRSAGLFIHCIHAHAPPTVKYRGCMSISQKITDLILVRALSLSSYSGNLSFQIPDNHTGKLSISSIRLDLKLLQHSFQLLLRHFLSRKFVM